MTASRYERLLRIASGGMAVVHVGRVRGAGGFSRLVAIKQARGELASDREARAAILEEAKLAAQVHHPHVVAVHDVEEVGGELWLVMDYVVGATLAELIVAANARDRSIPLGVALRIALDACSGLQAAHELTDELDRPIGLIHRDVSPQNILVGADGMSRITDFGIAKSRRADRLSTMSNVLKGKVAYMAPEYIEGAPIDARADVFGLGVVVWELIAQRRLFRGANEVETMRNVVREEPPSLVDHTACDAEVARALDGVLARALAKPPERRYASARAFASEIELVARAHEPAASSDEVATLVRELVGDELTARRARLRQVLGATERDEEELTTEVRAPVALAGLASRAIPLTRPAEATGDTATAMTVRESASAEGRPASERPAPRRPRALRRGLGALLALAAAAALLAAALPDLAPSPAVAPSQPRSVASAAAAARSPATPAASAPSARAFVAPLPATPSAKRIRVIAPAPSSATPVPAPPPRAPPPPPPEFAPNPYGAN